MAVAPRMDEVAVGSSRVGADRDVWRSILADVAVVTVTPFAGERMRDVDHHGLERNLQLLLGGGVRLLVGGGNTSEFAALSETEAMETVRTHARMARGRARLIAGVGYRLEKAIELGAGCIDAGADALMRDLELLP